MMHLLQHDTFSTLLHCLWAFWHLVLYVGHRSYHASVTSRPSTSRLTDISSGFFFSVTLNIADPRLFHTADVQIRAKSSARSPDPRAGRHCHVGNGTGLATVVTWLTPACLSQLVLTRTGRRKQTSCAYWTAVALSLVVNFTVSVAEYSNTVFPTSISISLTYTLHRFYPRHKLNHVVRTRPCEIKNQQRLRAFYSAAATDLICVFPTVAFLFSWYIK